MEQEISDATEEVDDSNIINSGEDGDDELTPKHNHPKNPPLTRSVGMARLQCMKGLAFKGVQKKTEVISYAKIRRNAPIKVGLA